MGMNLLGSLMSSGSNNIANNLATTLVAQALQNKPGGMMIGGHNFGGQMGGSTMGPSRGGYMDRRTGNDDYRVRITKCCLELDAAQCGNVNKFSATQILREIIFFL